MSVIILFGNAGLRQLRRLPDRLAGILGHSLMQEFHIQLAHLLAVISQPQFLIVCKFPDHGRLDVFIVEDFRYGLQILRLNGDDHSLLSFTDPDFGIAQAGILQRGFIQIDFGAKVLAHLSDGAAEPPCSAIRDSFI